MDRQQRAEGVRPRREAGGIDRLQGPIAGEMEAEGWTVRRDPIDQGLVGVRFLRGTFSVGAAIFEAASKVLAAMLVALIFASGCQRGEDMDIAQRAEARAVEARGYVDDLADQLGSDKEVLADDIGPCEPGDDEGLDLVYSLRVPVEPGSADRLRGEIADGLESDGWTVRRDADQGSEVSVRFLRGIFSMGAIVDESAGLASASGSSGCVK